MSDNISQDVAIRGEGNIVVGKGDVIINPLPPAEARLRHDLRVLLMNVQTTWIQGVLEKSLHEAALLDLGMEIREEAVDNPWRLVLEGPDQTRQALPRGRKIKDIFNEANRLLLILGEPGSGKTTTLLQLARDLIADVDEAFTEPVPIILNLSTWTNKQQPLDEWLIVELNSKYRLPKKDGRRWLEERRILPLLDGLDEVKVENRAVCVDKINGLVNEYGLHGLVVCSRIKDYIDLNVRLAFYRAIYIQPLTPEQIDEYFKQASEKLASLSATLESDKALRGLAQSPLILNIMTLAYQNASAEDLSNPTLSTDEARRKHLFDAYIARMFHRKGGTRQYDEEETKNRLSWLAQNMQQHNQDVFRIEDLQPSWLPTRHWMWIYTLISRTIPWMIISLVFTLISVLAGVLTGLELGGSLGNLLLSGNLTLLIGLAVGFIDMLRFAWLSKHRRIRKLPAIWWSVANITLVCLIFGLGYVVFTSRNLNVHSDLLIARLIFGSLFALPVGLIFGLRGSRQSLEHDIQTIEALHWSWRNALLGGLIGVLLGMLLVSSIYIWVYQSFRLTDEFWTEWVLPGVFLGGPIGLIFKGLGSEIIETKSAPNQGIHLSAKNAIGGGLIIGVIFGLTAELNLGLTSGSGNMTERLEDGLILGLMGVLTGALWYGGLDIIQHYTLRSILVLQGHTPANYARFLDYAADRIFLQKVGGGYRFIHRLLLEHFANMNKVGEAVPSRGTR